MLCLVSPNLRSLVSPVFVNWLVTWLTLLELSKHHFHQELLTYCITVWCGSCTKADRARLQSVVKVAQEIISCPLPSLMNIYSSRCLSRSANIFKDSSHPGFDLFNLLPSGKCCRCISKKTHRLANRFFPELTHTPTTQFRNWFSAIQGLCSIQRQLLSPHCNI